MQRTDYAAAPDPSSFERRSGVRAAIDHRMHAIGEAHDQYGPAAYQKIAYLARSDLFAPGKSVIAFHSLNARC